MKRVLSLSVIVTWLAAVSPLSATTYYVDGTRGNDASSGLSPEASLASIQAAASLVAPGDTIQIAEGVYYGPVTLNVRGTSDAPITLKAESRERYAVVITNANRELREGERDWELVDPELALYRATLERPTCRVLYSGTDLQPYLSLEALKTFTTADGNPGPLHGYYYDAEAKEIYVRLHASGRYGPSDPFEHVMAVGPRTGGGYAGNTYDGPHFYNLGLMERGPQHVIVDGITFETPGMAGVYVNGSDVTIRNCWFLGCRAGVSGRKESEDPAQTANRITVEYCDYSQYPAFDDMLEIIRTRSKPENTPKFPLYWWSRKGKGAGDSNTYEIGMCNLVGSDWVLRHNYIHDAFEGLATWGVRWSKNLDISRNRFERLVDNAIEMEDHTSGIRIHQNLIINAVEPLSWQPLGGEPWPGPVYIYGNVIRSDAALNDMITEAADWSPGWFKAGASAQNWDAPWNSHMKDQPRESVRAPGDGVVVFNNTVIFPGGYFLTRVHPSNRTFENFWFINNICAASGFSRQEDSNAENMRFIANVWIDLRSGETRAAIYAGEGGVVLEADSASATWSITADALLQPPYAQNFEGIAVPQASAVCAGAEDISSVGALMGAPYWSTPIVGPQL